MPRPIRATISASALSHNFMVAKAYAGGAVLDFQEAARLRVMGVKKPILMLEGFFKPTDVPLLHKYDLTPVIHNPEQVEMLRLAALPGEIDVYIKVNSGMNRLGFGVESLRPAYNALRMHAQVRNVTAMTHFADADGAGVKAQLEWFEEMIKPFDANQRSLANSAALIRY